MAPKPKRYVEVSSQPAELPHASDVFQSSQVMDSKPESPKSLRLPSLLQLKRKLSPQSSIEGVSEETSPLKEKVVRLPKKKTKIEALDSLPSAAGRANLTPIMTRVDKAARKLMMSAKGKADRIANAAIGVKAKLGRRPPLADIVEVSSQKPPPPKFSTSKGAAVPHYMSVDASRAITAARSTVFGLFESALSDSDEGRRAKPKRFDYDNDPDWTHLPSCHTMDAHSFFDNQLNDYSPHKYTPDKRIQVRYIGHPLDREKDIRARQFFVAWKDNVKPKKVRDTSVVFQVSYKCAKNCSPSSPRTSSNADHRNTLTASDDDDSVEGGGGLGGGKRKAGRPTKLKRKCPVRLIVQVLAGDLSTCIIYRKFTHGPVLKVENMDRSHFIRQGILEYARMQGYTAAKVKRRVTKIYGQAEIPLHRQHPPEAISHIVQNVRRSERIDADPMRCLEVFQEHNPSSVFHFSAQDMSTNPPSNFACGLKNSFALQSLILHSRTQGCGLDSCYRLKNEHRAPLTFLTTVNKQKHMLPGTVYLSSDIRSETIRDFLLHSRLEVEKHARDLVLGKVEIDPGHRDESARLLEEARYIDEHGWEPAFIMIDKCRANLNGIRAVWPKIVIRLCQFHIIQAIVRWDRDARGSKCSRPKLSIPRKYLLLKAVRELQRCRTRERWNSFFVPQFEARLDIVLDGCVDVTKSTVMAYFHANWFTDVWLESWTDMNLPADQYHEGHWSTNNWVERAFKTFDQIFLDSRANKSIFRLVLIIVNEWFPYYALWQNKESCTDPAAKLRRSDAWTIWSTDGAIVEIATTPKGTRRWRVADVEHGALKVDNSGRL